MGPCAFCTSFWNASLRLSCCSRRLSATSEVFRKKKSNRILGEFCSPNTRLCIVWLDLKHSPEHKWSCCRTDGAKMKWFQYFFFLNKKNKIKILKKVNNPKIWFSRTFLTIVKILWILLKFEPIHKYVEIKKHCQTFGSCRTPICISLQLLNISPDHSTETITPWSDP